MQRPRNHQPRDDSSRGRGRGRGRGSTSSNFGGAVPTTAQVTSGAFVSIVLKVDQPTGAEVQGVVQDVLTSGNHPRGIKVRLVDGRVGRVQRMVSKETADRGSQGLSGLGENGEAGGSNRNGRAPGRNERGREDDEEMNVPSSGFSFGDFLPPGHPLREDATRTDDRGDLLLPVSNVVEEQDSYEVCPVCGDFKGDAAAVSHHVNSHFDDS